MPTPPNSRDVIDLPELSNMDGLSPEERFSVYEEKILQFRDQVILHIVYIYIIYVHMYMCISILCISDIKYLKFIINKFLVHHLTLLSSDFQIIKNCAF